MRSVIKHSYIQPGGEGLGRALAHVDYLQRARGKDRNRIFFSAKEEKVDKGIIESAIRAERNKNYLVHKLTLSPGVQGVDLKEYAREVMSSLRWRKGLSLNWYAVEHHNSNNPHVHVVLMGSSVNGKTVKFFKDDYTVLRRSGDEHMQRNGFIEKIIDERTREQKLRLRHIRFREDWNDSWQEETRQAEKALKFFKKTTEKERVRSQCKPERTTGNSMQSNWLEQALKNDQRRREQELTRFVTSIGRPTRINRDADDWLRDISIGL